MLRELRREVQDSRPFAALGTVAFDSGRDLASHEVVAQTAGRRNPPSGRSGRVSAP